MALAVEVDIPSNPVRIRLLGAQTVMLGRMRLRTSSIKRGFAAVSSLSGADVIFVFRFAY